MDEYHLQIRRGSDLMGRWYLADVEVVRDIAERFTLYLENDELEFLADDALVFAYDGVTRMQEGWLKAQRKKRRNRRAAAEAARRKDATPDEEALAPSAIPSAEPEPTRARPRKATAPTSELAKKLAAIAAAEEAADPSKTDSSSRFTWAEAEEAERPVEQSDSFDWARVREEMAVRQEAASVAASEPASERPPHAQPAPTAPAADDGPERVGTQPANLKRRKPKVAKAPTPEPLPVPEPDPTPEPSDVPVWTIPTEPVVSEPAWIEPAMETPKEEPVAEVALEDVAWEEATAPAETSASEHQEAAEPAPSWIAPTEPESESESDLRSRFEALEEAARSNGEHPPAEPAESEPPPPQKSRRRSRDHGQEVELTIERTPAEPILESLPTVTVEAAKPDPREGHHPIESSTGFLGRLRRAPKVPADHVHVFQDARPSVGLTRRVCVECSHVSIGSED